ncbi:MAG: c-type cytochrome [Sphingobacteriales bacterium]|nr:MAG: c-type cytochrome [Sphingobacteriales bacterium]
MKTIKSLIFIALPSLIFTTAASAQTNGKTVEGSEIIARYNSGPNALTFLAIGVILTLILVLFLMSDISRTVKMLQQKHEETLPETEKVKRSSWFDLFRMKNKGKDSLQHDHVYDGIVEYDNNPPAWFNVLFYGTIAIAFCYMMYYHVLKMGDLQLTEYDKQMAAAEIVVAKAQERAIELAEKPPFTDNANLAIGQTIFTTNCVACHGDKGQGTIGPNLTDEYWLHGGEYKSIFKTIFNGVPEKGMLSWKKSLRPDELRAVASYVNTLRGTNPPNPKAPQGEKFAGEATASR